MDKTNLREQTARRLYSKIAVEDSMAHEMRWLLERLGHGSGTERENKL